MTVVEAFEALKGDLELPDRKQTQVANAQKQLRDQVSSYLDVPYSFLTGSYARYTKIFPLNDVDAFIVRNAQRTGLSASGGISPDEALNQLASAVQQAYPLTATVKKQNRSVNVQLFGYDFGFDLTPAWFRTPDGYWIPDRELNRWIPSDPEVHATRMTRENELNGGKLKPLIKMVKHWSRHNFDLLSSFHIELVCADIFKTENIDNFPLGMATVLAYLPQYVGQMFLDPVYGVSRVDRELSPAELEKLALRVRSDADRAVQALRLQKVAGEAASVEKWKEIFLTGFAS